MSGRGDDRIEGIYRANLDFDRGVREGLRQAKEMAQELVALVGHCDDPECKGKWCVTARAFIGAMSDGNDR